MFNILKAAILNKVYWLKGTYLNQFSSCLVKWTYSGFFIIDYSQLAQTEKGEETTCRRLIRIKTNDLQNCIIYKLHVLIIDIDRRWVDGLDYINGRLDSFSQNIKNGKWFCRFYWKDKLRRGTINIITNMFHDHLYSRLPF